MTLRTFAAVLLLSLPVLWAAQTRADSPAINVGYFNTLAVDGYDVMTYWRGGNPQEGNPDISAQYGDATWNFVSEENRTAFLADPEKYAPQYGGYCAYAAAQGSVSDVDVLAWQIYRDKLYLNYSDSVRRLWGSKIDEYIEKADALWPGLLSAN